MDGLNTVQTYIYWNLHEPVQGQGYDFSGNKNWTQFVELAAEAGLFVVLRIGPFVASEWDYGELMDNRVPKLGQTKLICCRSDSPVVFWETGKKQKLGQRSYSAFPSHVKTGDELLCTYAVPRARILPYPDSKWRVVQDTSPSGSRVDLAVSSPRLSLVLWTLTSLTCSCVRL